MRRHDLLPSETPEREAPTRDRPGVRYLWTRRIGWLLLLGVLLAAALGPWRAEIFAPGELAQPHAQILANRTGHDRCATCHPAARGRLSDWFDPGRAGHEQVTQSQLCMECHHATIAPGRERLAHNLTAAELRHASATSAGEVSLSHAALSWHDSMPRPNFGMADVHCSACHREHQGKMADLTRISDAQCQTCHQDRFASFAEGHPDWGSWPYGRAGQIAFDHSRHAGEHFAKQARTFECRSCHEVTSDGTIARTGSFEATCVTCHDAALDSQTSLGFDLIALPILNVHAAEEAGEDVGPWPEAATGSDRISLTPLTRLWLASDPKTAAAIEELTSPTANLWQGPPSPSRLRATATLIRGLRQLIDALADDLHGEAARRLGITPPADFLGQLSPQLIAGARQRWFAPPPLPTTANSTPLDRSDAPAPAPEQSLSANRLLLAPQPNSQGEAGDGSLLADPLLADPLLADPLLADPLLADPLLADPLLADPLLADPLLADPLLADPLASHASAGGVTEGDRLDQRRFDAVTELPAGGWYRDDLRLAIGYRAAGHADPVLQALFERATDPSLSSADRDALLALPPLAACAECHQGARQGTWTGWTSRRSDADRRGFTRFTHRPHMHLPELADCTHCHRVAPTPLANLASGAAGISAQAPITTVSVSTSPTLPTQRDFAPLTRETCAQCHTPHSAGDRCTQCHRYHLDPP